MHIPIRSFKPRAMAGCAALLLAVSFPGVTWSAPSASERCSALSSLHIVGGQIVSATHVVGPFNTPPSMSDQAVTRVRERVSRVMAAEMAHGTVKVSFCRVAGILTPTPSSEIHFETWLPENNYNGRLVQEGDGGLLGAIPYTLMSKLINRGFAVTGSDKGHNNFDDPMEWHWAVDQPEKVIDHHYRATHVTGLAAKMLVAQFYGTPAHHTYFSGCSGGAVQGYESAMHNPDDFDGMAIGGAGPPRPTSSSTPSETATSSGFLETILAESKGLEPAKLQMVSRAALAACDKADGVEDGVNSHPKQCAFDPATLACHEGTGANCLTALEVDAIRRGYALGMAAGTEYYWRFAEELGSIFPPEARRSLALPPPADQLLLQGFAAGGHKMITYIGTVDIGSPQFERFQEALVDKQQRERGGTSHEQAEHNVALFYRAFELPGMEHCAGGAGPNNISASLQPEQIGVGPEQDIMEALVNWVEHGKAPERLVATKYTDDDPAKPIRMTRPLCVYPKVALWNKKDDPSDYRSFTCANATPSQSAVN
jgi:feruloyl esterase